MLLVIPEPVPTEAQCIQGGYYSVPCQRRGIYLRRVDTPPQLLAYIDEPLDSDGVDSHLSDIIGVYIDPTKCDLYMWLWTYCYGQTTDCTLYDPAKEVIRIHGLRGSKCSLH
jgi:hypothetical protein